MTKESGLIMSSCFPCMVPELQERWEERVARRPPSSAWRIRRIHGVTGRAARTFLAVVHIHSTDGRESESFLIPVWSYHPALTFSCSWDSDYTYDFGLL